MAYDIGAKIGIEGESAFRSTINQINTNMRTLDTELQKVTSGFDAGDNSIEAFTAKSNVLNKRIDEQKNKISELNKGLNLSKEKYGENDRVTQSWQQSVNKATTDLNNMERELKNNKQTMESTNNTMGSFTKAILGIGVAGGAVALGLGVKAFKGANDFKGALNDVIAKTGLTNDETTKLGQTLENIYKNNYGESYEDIANAMAEVNQQTKLTGEALEKTTTYALMLRDTFDYDVGESIRSANMLMSQFGMSAEEAYTLIAQGTQEGLNKNGDLLDTINEYSVHFKQLGFDSEDMFNMLINGANSGTFSVDKLGDAVKEFGIRAKDGSNTTIEAYNSLGLNVDELTSKFAEGGEKGNEAFNQVITALFNLKDPVEQNKIGVNLFGSMWEDLGIEGVKALTELDKSVDKNADTLKKIDEIKYDTPIEALKGLGRTIETDILNPIGEKLMPKIKEIIDKIKSPEVQESIQGIASKVSDFVNLILDNGETIISTIAGIGAGLITWNVVSMIDGVVKSIKAFQLANEGATIAQWAMNVAMNANPIGILIAVIAGLVAGVIVLWNTNEDFRNAVIGAWDAIKATGSAVFGWLKKFFTEDIPNAFNAVVNFFKNNWKEILLFITNPIAGALALLYKINPKFKEWVDGLWKKIVDTIKSIGDIKWGEVGTNIIKGIAEGVTNAAKSLSNAVVDSAKKALNGVKNFLGIHSPSRVMRDQVGKMIGAGMAEGIADSTRQVNNAMQGINNQIIADGTLNIKTNSNSNDTQENNNATQSEDIVINNYTTLDGKVVAKSTSRIQATNNRSKSRAWGVVPA